MTGLFEEVLHYFIPWRTVRRFVEFIASLILRRVYDAEENEGLFIFLSIPATSQHPIFSLSYMESSKADSKSLELKGIAKASGVAMYFLVALNVLLDSMLGCTSGGALVQPAERKRRSKKPPASPLLADRMMHFRTLDWDMDALRDVLVVLEFVHSKSATPEKVVARSITYAGFVGCVTGVREGLSLSLNFRPRHYCKGRYLRWHQFLVLFGVRRSVISVLRGLLLAENSTEPLGSLASKLASTATAPCYMVLCDGNETVVIEKDLRVCKQYSPSCRFGIIANRIEGWQGYKV